MIRFCIDHVNVGVIRVEDRGNRRLIGHGGIVTVCGMFTYIENLKLMVEGQNARFLKKGLRLR